MAANTLQYLQNEAKGGRAQANVTDMQQPFSERVFAVLLNKLDQTAVHWLSQRDRRLEDIEDS